jgi:hypothetical protein
MHLLSNNRLGDLQATSLVLELMLSYPQMMHKATISLALINISNDQHHGKNYVPFSKRF